MNSNKSINVSINVGKIERVLCELKIKRGSRVIVQVPKNANVQTIKRLAIEKHSNLDQYFCVSIDYVLLYPDCKVIVDLPGGTEPFQLDKYKEFLGKPFQRVDLYLCSKDDFLSNMSYFSENDADVNTEDKTLANDYGYLPEIDDFNYVSETSNIEMNAPSLLPARYVNHESLHIQVFI